jgi:uncharacterized phage protein (TIGR01671 family)
MEIENIKFKAKQLNSGKWFEGDLVRLGNRVCIGGDHIKDGITDVDPSTVCMFTGLKDCDGKEIWEGDIVEREIYDLFNGSSKVKSVIEYMDGAFVAITDGIAYSLFFKYLKVFDKEK